MIGILVIICISWILLYFFEHRTIDAIGILPTKTRLLQLLSGFIFIILLKGLFIYSESIVQSVEWTLNKDIDLHLIFRSAWYHLKSALTEDLLFRGALLFILIRRIGEQKAILISAIAFGVYHWFSYNMFGSGIIQMAYIFIITGLSGYVWAVAFSKTGSIMLPLGFHFGWNFMISLFYTSSPFGQLIFIETSRVVLSDWSGLFYALFEGILPSLITFYFVNRWVIRTKSSMIHF